ncbi:T9SS-dependent M36 family metallopeptidase [Hymenobacter sp. BT190]|uniref:T9SS-dependent M36 family metallopeptidase n=1 Tax=Hymenobacter sp. BT190 TaxID=2763505 RepID=UPI0016519CAD|nr:T9SS-dependent M36 family metallopeptidase [Hymenobacter sp. BT190]MBC6698957.1 T9SS-dependent M36 family metallopeptidase [Hymenobacter sp. BT190]
MWVLLLLLLVSASALGQQQASRRAVPVGAARYLQQHQQQLGLTDATLADLVVSSETMSRHNGVKHFYLQQQYQGIDIHGALSTVSLSAADQVLNVEARFQALPQARNQQPTTRPVLGAAEAVAAAARILGLSMRAPLTLQTQARSADRAAVFSTAGISLEPISARLVYQPLADGQLRLAWEVAIYELSALNAWNIRLDAATGQQLDRDNLVTHCEFDNNGAGGLALGAQPPLLLPLRQASMLAAPTANAYNVFPIPAESPSHGTRDFVATTAADATASPAGWQTAGATSYTTTRGNNVHAYEDPTNNNNGALNYSPNAGASLLFDYPIDFTQQPVTYRDAAITNLFYMNNIMHDIWYQYGFDEMSGSFQVDNFGRGGIGNDDVRGEAQDSRNIATTRNNANFFTPADGLRPRMQMYLWSGIPDPDMFKVTAPAALAGSYKSVQASFSAPLTPVPVTGKLVLAATAVGVGQEGCTTFSNATAMAGNIAVVYRGSCTFAQKVQNAQEAGAIAAIVINNVAGDPTAMGGTAAVPITIPAVMIGQADGATIRAALDAAQEVRVALRNVGSGPEIDGDFDNGIIAHEYGHGISNRLTGGPAVVNCLQNAEQMGEGWSDWFGLMLTMKTGDTSPKRRGIGTYALGQATTAQGIRPAPYSTDFAVNDYTYGDTNSPTLTQPHGVGFVWCTMLWDLNWALIDRYGYDANLYSGTGGNNLAMQLVMDGMKGQACSPGFVDGRNAILAADMANGGLNQKLIWQVFAKRGLGFGASQGLRTSRSDQVENFDLPPLYACNPPTITVSPLTTFVGGAPKTIYLGYGLPSLTLQASGVDIVSYSWAPATGLSSTSSATPVFTPTAPGTYTFTVTATNINSCVETAQVTINVVDVRCGNRNDKVQVCHRGNSICISSADVIDHLRHGDNVGVCGSAANASMDDMRQPKALLAESELFTSSPNPATASTRLAFQLTDEGSYRVEVLNLQGSVVAVVAEGQGKAGQTYTYEFRREKLAAGLYMARLQTSKGMRFTRILLQD